MSPNTFRSSPPSSFISSCRCPLALSPTSHCQRPSGKFARPARPFLLHPDGLHREPFFASMGEPDPWGSIINPLWAAHLVDVEEAWDRATEPNPHLKSGEPPTSPQLYQTEAPLDDVLAPRQLVESLVRVLVSPPPVQPPESVLSRPQTEALLETVAVVTLPGDLRRVFVEEEPSQMLWLSPFILLPYEVLGSFPLKCLFPSSSPPGHGRNGGLLFASCIQRVTPCPTQYP